jgi:hypothetical protein
MERTIELINDFIDLTEWKTKKQINKELGEFGIRINERTFRQKVEDHNNLYFAHKKDFFIAHSNKGYKITTDTEEIRKSLRDSFKRGIDQITKYHKGIKALGENANFSLIIKDNELIFREE